MQKDENPSVDDVISALESGSGEIDWVVQMPGGEKIDPPEIWVGPVHAWVRADGSSICGDLGRGHTYAESYPGTDDAGRLRAAIDQWNALRALAGGE